MVALLGATLAACLRAGVASALSEDCGSDSAAHSLSLLQVGLSAARAGDNHRALASGGSSDIANTIIAAYAAAASPAQREHLWPQKNGGARRAGISNLTSTLQLATPAWELEDAGSGVLYQSPVLDRDGNIYMSSTNGRLFSLLLKDGSERWSVQLGGNGPQMPTPILLGESLYTTDGFGYLICLALSDGAERWRARFTDGNSGGDSWSMGGLGDVVLVLGSPLADGVSAGSGTRLYAASAVDGKVLWNFKFASRLFNAMPAIAGDAVVFADCSGGAYSVGLADGKLRWEMPSPGKQSFTTGGLAIGPNDLVYVTSNIDTGCAEGMPFLNPSNCGDGVLRAHSLRTGEVRWNRTFVGFPANNAPAVYTSPAGGLNVVIGVGQNPPAPYQIPELDAISPMKSPDKVVALDATTGADRWTFDTPVWTSNAGAGSTSNKTCWPDTWSNAAVDGSGTVYIGWMGGRLFALGGATGAKLAEYDLRSSTQGEPAIAPGALVASSCNRLAAFHEAK